MTMFLLGLAIGWWLGGLALILDIRRSGHSQESERP